MTVLLETQEAPAANGTYTADDLLKMPDGPRFELVDGKLVERHMGAKSSQVGSNVIAILYAFVKANFLGKVFSSECGYLMFPDHPNRVRYPDASFIARGRLPGDKTPSGHVRLAPDLTMEAVSPNDLADEVETKRLEYLRAGVKQVWIVYPESRTVHIHQANGSCRVLTEADMLDNVDVLPGFTCPVAAIFEGIG